MQHFASDNYAGICPESLAALIAANHSGHEPADGDDSWTNRVCDRLRERFQTDCEGLMCAWDTQAETVERFAAEVRELCAA